MTRPARLLSLLALAPLAGCGDPAPPADPADADPLLLEEDEDAAALLAMVLKARAADAGEPDREEEVTVLRWSGGWAEAKVTLTGTGGKPMATPLRLLGPAADGEVPGHAARYRETGGGSLVLIRRDYSPEENAAADREAGRGPDAPPVRRVAVGAYATSRADLRTADEDGNGISSQTRHAPPVRGLVEVPADRWMGGVTSLTGGGTTTRGRTYVFTADGLDTDPADHRANALVFLTATAAATAAGPPAGS